MRSFRLITLALAFALAGCVATPDPLTAAVPDLTLAAPFVRNHLELPAGRYVATSRNATGIFYRPERTVFLASPRGIVARAGLWRSDDGKSWGTFVNEGQAFAFQETPVLAP